MGNLSIVSDISSARIASGSDRSIDWRSSHRPATAVAAACIAVGRATQRNCRTGASALPCYHVTRQPSCHSRQPYGNRSATVWRTIRKPFENHSKTIRDCVRTEQSRGVKCCFVCPVCLSLASANRPSHTDTRLRPHAEWCGFRRSREFAETLSGAITTRLSPR